MDIQASAAFRPVDSCPPPGVAWANFYAPRPRATDVPRIDLLARLNHDPCRCVTTVVAPAGSGKSTLVGQWMDRTAIPKAWVTLGEGDGQPHRFFALVVAALDALEPGIMSGTTALLNAQQPFDAEHVVHRLVAELTAINRRVVLVLDDYHVATAETHRAMGLLVSHLPSTLQVVLVGRFVAAVRSPSSSDNLVHVELRPQDLAFTQAEASAFFRQGLGLDLATSEIDAICLRTEALPVGLHLAGLALRSHSRHRIQEMLADFDSSVHGGIQDLWDLVIQDLPPDFRSFLVRTALLDRFTPGLCDAMIGIADSERHIQRCVLDGLFVIPLDAGGAWYRYHGVFAEALRNRLALVATADEVNELHRRAARWLADHGFIEDAVRHAVAGRDWDRAVALLEDECASLFARDHVARLRDRLEGLPDPVLARSPRLAFWLAWALGRTGEWAEAEQVFQKVEGAWSRDVDPANRGVLLFWEAAFRFDGLKAIAATHEALDLLPEERSVERIFALSIQATHYLRRGEPAHAELAITEQRSLAVTAGLARFELLAMAHWAGGLIQRGLLGEAADLCRRVIESVGPQPVENWVQAAHYHLGAVCFEWGRLDATEKHLRRAEELAELTGSIQWRERICVGLARLSWARGEHDEARAHLDRALFFATRVGKYQPVRDIKAWQARFWLAANDVDRARRWAEESGFDPTRPAEYQWQVERLTYVRSLIRDGRPDLALSVLDAVNRHAQSNGRDGELVELAVLEALAHAAAGRQCEAQRSIRRALEIGQSEGYARVFLDEGEALTSLLRCAANDRDHGAYARRLLVDVLSAGAQ